jgi:hypothetical protein
MLQRNKQKAIPKTSNLITINTYVPDGGLVAQVHIDLILHSYTHVVPCTKHAIIIAGCLVARPAEVHLLHKHTFISISSRIIRPVILVLCNMQQVIMTYLIL